MRVFVTGATGFIGSAIVRDLLAAGHDVLGLARNDAGAETLARSGIAAHRGDLRDTNSLAAGARGADGVIHTAFIHDFSRFEECVEFDRLAVTALIDALAGSNKPLVIASGTMMVAHARPATEQDTAQPGMYRGASEAAILSTPTRGVRGSVVRLSPTVHGAGDHGFIAMLIALARRAGVAAFVGDGANRWPAVHRLDAARLFRLALENAAPGSRLHAAAESGIPMRAIAEVIGEGVGVPVRGLSEEEARAHFDWMARFVAADNPTSSALTRETLGWRPEGPELLTDIRENGYLG